MKEKETYSKTFFICSLCGEKYETLDVAQACYEECLEDKKQDEAAQRKFEKEEKARFARLVKKCRSIVRGKQGSAFRCLVKNGFIDDARILFFDLIFCVNSLEVHSGDKEILFQKMIQANFLRYT